MKIIVLTGAGMSAESGLSTFRDNGGLWDKYNVYEVATPEAWNNNRDLVLQFYNERRNQLYSVQPNYGHIEIALWEKYFNVQIVTQNVDDLHERSGSSNVLHLHGELKKSRSTGPSEKVYEINGSNLSGGDLCEDGFQLRPHIVWFGEDVPKYEDAERLVKSCDLLVVVGTSLNVYPAAGLIYKTNPNTPIYVIDPNALEALPKTAIHIKEKASTGLKKLTNILLHKYLL